MPREIRYGQHRQNGLENLHFNKKAVDDRLSLKAFEEYIEFLDFSKRFLLTGDVKN